jgi:hypothetical protein
VIASWVSAAMHAEPAVQEWREHHHDCLQRCERRSASILGRVGAVVDALFAAEGGSRMVAEVARTCEAAYQHEHNEKLPSDLIRRQLPDGTHLAVAASQRSRRSPVATLCYPNVDGTVYLSVLRDAQLGELVGIADTLAERYLLPVSDVVCFILTGTAPRLAPLRLGLRFRSFEVQGVPVTASSRVMIEVDPQIEAADLARTFAHWQRTNRVVPCHTDPKLVAPAGSSDGEARKANRRIAAVRRILAPLPYRASVT